MEYLSFLKIRKLFNWWFR